MYIVKVVKFRAYPGVRYHKTNAKTGKFINEGTGFKDEGINTFQHVDESKIIETWFNVIIGEQTIPFFLTYDKALSFVKEIKELNKQAKQRDNEQWR